MVTLQASDTCFRGSSNDSVLWPEDSSDTLCPGRAAEMRLHRFESSWDPTNSISTEEEILKLKESDILFDRMLGYGSFSTVRRVYLRNQATESFESRPFAVKQLKPEILYDQQRLKSASADLALETKILAYLKHDNIIALRGVAEGDMIEFLKAGKFFIVLDLLLETLDTRLDRWRRQFKRSLFQIRSEITLTKRLRDVALGIANGMEYLHSKNIMFRDLKPQNVGFDEYDCVKIFDFGLAREHSVDAEGRNLAKPRLMSGGAGTPRYMAPEVARLDTSYGFPADVYSFSILLWQIVTNRVPYGNISLPEFAVKVVRGNKRPPLKLVESDELKALLESGWAVDPNRRPDFVFMRRSLQRILENRPSFVRLSKAQEPPKKARFPRRRTKSSPGGFFCRLGSGGAGARNTQDRGEALVERIQRTSISSPPSLAGTVEPTS